MSRLDETGSPGRFVWVNDHACELLGYDREELLRMSPEDITTGSDRDRLAEIWDTAAAGKTHTSQMRYRTKQRPSLPVQVSVHPITPGDQEYMIFVVQTLSEQNEAERRFETLLGNLRGMVYRCRNARDWPMEFVSEGTEVLTGYAPEEFVKERGVRYGDVIHPADRQYVWKTVQEALKAGRHFELEYRIVTRSQEVKWVWERGTAVLRGGEVEAIEGLIADITQRKEAEESLRLSEEQYRDLFENAPLWIFRTTSSGKILAVNTAMAEMLGFDSPDETVEYYDDLADQLYVRPFRRREFLRLLQKRGAVENFEFEARTLEGETLWLNMNARVAGELEDGGFEIEGFATDITGRKRAEREKAMLEEQFRQAQKLESIGRLAGGVAHDFNNLLTVIKGNADLLASKIQDEPHRHMLNMIVQAGDQAADLTRQLLAFSRKQDLEPRPIQPTAVLEGMEHMLQRVLGEDIHFCLEVGETSATILIDPGRFQQVLMNMAVNARDAMPRGGELVVTARIMASTELPKQIRKEFSDKTDEVFNICITDTGIGMDLPTQTKIFEPFFTTKKQGEGTGLGLATVYGIVKQSGGEITVESTSGEGSTFKLYFPVIEADIEREKPSRSIENRRDPALQDAKILVLDDEKGICQFIRAVLEPYPVEVQTVMSGERAVDFIRSANPPYDLLLSDVVLPRMSGPEVAEKCTKIQPDLRVVFMTGYTDEKTRRYLETRKSIALRKPFQPEDVLRVISQALGTG